MRNKSSESEVLEMVKAGQIELTASIQVDGFRKRAASQLPQVSAWIAAQIRGFTRLTPEKFLMATQVAWYLRRDGETYGPLSHQAILRLGSVLLESDEVFSMSAQLVFSPAELQQKKIEINEKAA